MHHRGFFFGNIRRLLPSGSALMEMSQGKAAAELIRKYYELGYEVEDCPPPADISNT